MCVLMSYDSIYIYVYVQKCLVLFVNKREKQSGVIDKRIRKKKISASSINVLCTK